MTAATDAVAPAPTARAKQAVSSRVRRAGSYAGGVLNAGLVFLVLRPASRALPTQAARKVPAALGWALSKSPRGRRLRASLARAFPSGPHSPDETCRAILAEPYRQYVVARQVLHDQRVIPGEGRAIVEMSDAARSLLDSDTPFVMAVGHFSREAAYAATITGLTPRMLHILVAPRPARRLGLNEVAQHEMFESVKRAGMDTRYAEEVARGEQTVADLVQMLRNPGHALHVHVDVMVKTTPSGSFARPFAGSLERRFVTGGARIARLAQVPIVLCEARLDRLGNVVIRWFDPIAPPAVDDEESDVRVTSRLLDEIERDVGRRPAQYVQGIGSKRSWDPVREAWHG